MAEAGEAQAALEPIRECEMPGWVCNDRTISVDLGQVAFDKQLS